MEKSYLYQAKDAAIDAVGEVGEELKKHYGKVEYELKEGMHNNFLTELDRKTELFLRERLLTFDPAIMFRGEEFGGEESATSWLVDPIDGTTHFVRGLPFCTTMVALIDNDKVALAVIHDFIRDDTYWAIRGEGAYCNEDPIHVSDRGLKHGMFTCETDLSKSDNLSLYLKLRETTRLIDTMSGGYEFALVASGKIEGRISKDPWGSDYDYAPGALLVREAGGKVANIGQDNYDYHNTSHLATNAVVFDELTKGPQAIYPIQD